MDTSIWVALIVSSGGVVTAMIGAWASTERVARPLRERIIRLEMALRAEGVNPDEVS